MNPFERLLKQFGSPSSSEGDFTFGYGSSSGAPQSVGWENMSETQRLAHSIKHGTPYQEGATAEEIAAAQRYLEKDSRPGVYNSGDTLAQLYADENTRGQAEEQAANNDYGFSNAQQGSYDDMVARGRINPDGTLNTDGMSQDEIYELYIGGFGLGDNDTHRELQQQAYDAWVSGQPQQDGPMGALGPLPTQEDYDKILEAMGGGFGGGNAGGGNKGGGSGNKGGGNTGGGNTGGGGGATDPNAFFDIGRSGVYEAGIYDDPDREGSIASFLTDKTWDQMTPAEQAAHAIMRGELSYYSDIDPELYQAGIELLQSETGDSLSNMGWYSRLEAIDRIRDREAEGIQQGVSLSDALRRSGFDNIEGYDAYIDLVNQGLVDWDGDLNLESNYWTPEMVDDLLAGKFENLGNTDLANYMYNQLGNISFDPDEPDTEGTGPNGPLDDPDNPPWGYGGGYDWNWDDFQPGAPSLEGGGGYDPNDYAFDRYVPGQQSPWGIPEAEGGNKDFYRNQFVNLLRDEQNFRERQREADAIRQGADPLEPSSMDWSWIEGGLPEVQIGGETDYQYNSDYSDMTNSQILNYLKNQGDISNTTYNWFNDSWGQTGNGDATWWGSQNNYDSLANRGEKPWERAAYSDLADAMYTNYGTPDGVAVGYAAPVAGYNPRRRQSGPANTYNYGGAWGTIPGYGG